MILLKVVNGVLKAKVDNKGWELLPSGNYLVRFSDDENLVSMRSTDSYLFEVENYLISNILDADNGNTPFTASTLESFLLGLGFFSSAIGGGGYGTGQYITAISNADQNINNTEAPILFQNVLESKGITLQNDSEFILEKSGLVTVYFEFNIEIGTGNTDLEFWVEKFNSVDGIFEPIIISGNVFELTGRTEGTKTYIYQAEVEANQRYRLIASTTGDVTFASKPLVNNPFVSTIGAKLRIR